MTGIGEEGHAVPAKPSEQQDVRAETFYIAVCSRCGDRPDADGYEYGATPAGALIAAENCDWGYTVEEPYRVLCSTCLYDDDQVVARAAEEEALARSGGPGSTGSVAEGPSSDSVSGSCAASDPRSE